LENYRLGYDLTLVDHADKIFNKINHEYKFKLEKDMKVSYLNLNTTI